MLMTVSSLLIAGSFALAVEGQLPTEPGCWDLLGSGLSNCSATGHVMMVEVAAVHYVLLACGLGLQLCVVMGCLALTGRFAEFMDLRVQKQQLLNKDLRRAAVKMIGDVDLRNPADDRETIRKFEKVLRQQYVIETCDASVPREGNPACVTAAVCSIARGPLLLRWCARPAVLLQPWPWKIATKASQLP